MCTLRTHARMVMSLCGRLIVAMVQYMKIIKLRQKLFAAALFYWNLADCCVNQQTRPDHLDLWFTNYHVCFDRSKLGNRLVQGGGTCQPYVSPILGRLKDEPPHYFSFSAGSIFLYWRLRFPIILAVTHITIPLTCTEIAFIDIQIIFFARTYTCFKFLQDTQCPLVLTQMRLVTSGHNLP